MKTIRFKTNINCSNCLAKVTPSLNHKEGIVSWNVDLDNPDKILTSKPNRSWPKISSRP